MANDRCLHVVMLAANRNPESCPWGIAAMLERTASKPGPRSAPPVCTAVTTFGTGADPRRQHGAPLAPQSFIHLA